MRFIISGNEGNLAQSFEVLVDIHILYLLIRGVAKQTDSTQLKSQQNHTKSTSGLGEIADHQGVGVFPFFVQAGAEERVDVVRERAAGK